MKAKTLVLSFLLTALLQQHALALAATRWVNDDDPNGGGYAPPGTSCNNPGYSTIQDAVDAASAGDTIRVCAGVYAEQVVIDTSLILRGNAGATIKAPSPMVADGGPANMKSIIRVTSATTQATIDNFTITGPGDSGCGSINAGIKVMGGATARIENNHITAIRDEPFSGCQNGQGIWVGRKADETTGTADIRNNLIDNYQKGGIVVDNTGSSAMIVNNVVEGIGPTDKIAQNGIQVSRGATGTVRRNNVSDNIYTPGTDASSGILLFGQGPKVLVERNFVANNDLGIPSTTFGGAFGEVSPITKVKIRRNVVDNSTFDGIELIDTKNSEVSRNEVTGSGVDGVFIDTGSTGNKLKVNQISGSGEHDAHDNNGAGDNTWTGNNCTTQNIAGLC